MKQLVRFLAPPFAFFLVACTPSAKIQSGEGQRIQIFYNNDNFAYLETCGCRISPIGGMDRRWNGMKAYPDDSRIFLDAGNLLFKSSKAAETLAPQWQEQALGVIEAYNLLGADAVEVGETEFALGIDKFKEIAAKAHFPFISSNLVWKKNRQLFLRDFVLIHRQGKKIGVFGLFGQGLRVPSELEIQDPVEAAKRMVSRLKSEGADMVIALTHQGYDADVQLAKKVSGIDLIVGGHSQSLLQRPYQEGDTLLVQLSNEGQMLGMVEYEAASLPKKRTNFVVTELNGEFNEGPKDLANPMKNLVAVTNLRIQEANRDLDEVIWGSSKASPSDGFSTELSCRDCHGKQAEFHDKKPHSAAFLTLMAQHKEFNLDCVKCHSVGLGEPGGFTSMADAFRDDAGMPVPLEKIRAAAGANFPSTKESYRANPAKIPGDVKIWHEALKKAGVKKAFVTVQCENCHGLVGGHPFGSGHYGKVQVKTCLNCHTPEQAPSWYSKSGKLVDAKAKAALASMKCPR